MDPQTSTFTYLLADERTRDAVLVDCVFEQHLRDLALVRELGLTLRMTLETHVHADHVTGAWSMKTAVGSEVAVARDAHAHCADRELAAGDVLTFGALRLEVRSTPGHTAACLSFVLPGERMVFTGDALLIRGAGRTDFQEGNAHTLFESVRRELLTLPEDYLVYPAHDYGGRCQSTIGEEKRFNPRLGDGVRERDFVGYMENLALPHPKKLAVAVPANLRCGRPPDGAAAAVPPDWAPVIRTYAGVWQIEPEWVHAHRREVLVVDVRERDEIAASPLESVPDALVLPLSELRARVGELPRDRPVVFVCPAGARSAIAATILEAAGGERVANMRGGILEWRALGFPAAKPVASS
jgi:glyoxylase-like metal-dependent hydrolase (beta-lactamase superfamily II)/rhodanese-related sulfurtransferase